jgi:DNA-binding MarR family transcriptional regulator
MARRKNEVQNPEGESKGYFAYEGLNRVLHEKARLGILTALRTRAEGLVFAELKQLCSLTDGNLSRHLTVLQESALVAIKKGQLGNRPQTVARLTTRGRKEFDAYIEELQKVIQDASIRIAPIPDASKGDAPGIAPA